MNNLLNVHMILASYSNAFAVKRTLVIRRHELLATIFKLNLRKLEIKN